MPQFHFAQESRAVDAAKRLKRVIARHRRDIGLNRAHEALAIMCGFRDWRDMRKSIMARRHDPSPIENELGTVVELHARRMEQTARLANFLGIEPNRAYLVEPIVAEASVTANVAGGWRTWTYMTSNGPDWVSRFVLPSMDPEPRIPASVPRLSKISKGIASHSLSLKQVLSPEAMAVLTAKAETDANLIEKYATGQDEGYYPDQAGGRCGYLLFAGDDPVGWFKIVRECEDLDFVDFDQRDDTPNDARMSYSIRDMVLLPEWSVGARGAAARSAVAGQMAEWLLVDVHAIVRSGVETVSVSTLTAHEEESHGIVSDALSMLNNFAGNAGIDEDALMVAYD